MECGGSPPLFRWRRLAAGSVSPAPMGQQAAALHTPPTRQHDRPQTLESFPLRKPLKTTPTPPEPTAPRHFVPVSSRPLDNPRNLHWTSGLRKPRSKIQPRDTTPHKIHLDMAVGHSNAHRSAGAQAPPTQGRRGGFCRQQGVTEARGFASFVSFVVPVLLDASIVPAHGRLGP